MLESNNGPLSALFSGSEPSSHTEVNGDPQIGPAIPWDEKTRKIQIGHTEVIKPTYLYTRMHLESSSNVRFTWKVPRNSTETRYSPAQEGVYDTRYVPSMLS